MLTSLLLFNPIPPTVPPERHVRYNAIRMSLTRGHCGGRYRVNSTLLVPPVHQISIERYILEREESRSKY